MCEQENPLRVAVNYLCEKLGYDNSQIDDDKLLDFLWYLSKALELVHRLFELNIMNWDDACSYVWELEIKEIEYELALSEEELKRHILIYKLVFELELKEEQEAREYVFQLSPDELEGELKLSNDELKQKHEELADFLENDEQKNNQSNKIKI